LAPVWPAVKRRGNARVGGVKVELYEMRPMKSTPAHQTDKFAELVCSNSLKSESENTAPWLLKEEMRRIDALLLRIAKETSVPAGHALAVDRETFAAKSHRSHFRRAQHQDHPPGSCAHQ